MIGKGWVAAGDLVEGNEVYNLDGTTSTILGSEIEVLDEPVLVYNLEVEDFHSYFVGCVPVLVHNKCDVGSYTIVFESGKKYHGKGSISRMLQSAKEKFKKYGDKAVGFQWSRAANNRQAFIDEHFRILFDGGIDNPMNYNRINSPGKKFLNP